MVAKGERPIEAAVVTVRHAAEILGRPREQIDGLVREAKVVSIEGKGGKGGQYRVRVADLWLLDAAAELIELKVPRSSVREMLVQLTEYGRAVGAGEVAAGEVALVYGPQRQTVVPHPDAKMLFQIAHEGAVVVKVIDTAKVRKSLAERARAQEEPAPRGRPKLNREWMREQLKKTAALGGDESAEELAEMLGDRGALPWRNGS
jgi:hypothetical protein